MKADLHESAHVPSQQLVWPSTSNIASRKPRQKHSKQPAGFILASSTDMSRARDEENIFLYAPLLVPQLTSIKPLVGNGSAEAIRLFRLRGFDECARVIDVEMQHFKLGSPNQTPPFAALSYTWGSGVRSHRLNVNGKVFQIGENAWTFLGCLWMFQAQARSFRNQRYGLRGLEHGQGLLHMVPRRLGSQHRHAADSHPEETLFEWLWMDGICIDQANIGERNHQVGLMSKIYAMASHVYVFLADRMGYDPGLRKRLQDEIAASLKRDLPRLVHRKGCQSPETYRYFRFLFCQGYWKRVWIVQEFILAKAITMFTPEFVIPEDTITIVSQNLRLEEEDARSNTRWPALDIIKLRHIHTLDTMASTGRSIKVGLTLTELLSVSARLECIHPQDHIHGMLGLSLHFGARKDVPWYLRADYSLSNEDFCIVWAKELMVEQKMNPSWRNMLDCIERIRSCMGIWMRRENVVTAVREWEAGLRSEWRNNERWTAGDPGPLVLGGWSQHLFDYGGRQRNKRKLSVITSAQPWPSQVKRKRTEMHFEEDPSDLTVVEHLFSEEECSQSPFDYDVQLLDERRPRIYPSAQVLPGSPFTRKSAETALQDYLLRPQLEPAVLRRQSRRKLPRYRNISTDQPRGVLGFQEPWVRDRTGPLPLGISELADTILDNELYREMMAEHIERRIGTHIS